MSKAPVTLFNRDRHMSFQFTLYHHIVCAAAKRCFCERKPAMEADRRGEFDRAEASVFIPPRGTTRPLPAEVLLVPQVQAALCGPQPPKLMQLNVLASVQVIKS